MRLEIEKVCTEMAELETGPGDEMRELRGGCLIGSQESNGPYGVALVIRMSVMGAMIAWI